MKRSEIYLSLFKIPLALLIALLILVSSCEPTPVNFTRADRKLIDSLFQKQKASINIEVDSICKIWAEKNLKNYKDSLQKKRWSEIEQILKSEE